MKTTVNQRFNEVITKNNIQQIKIAKLLNVSKQQINNWLSDINNPIPARHIVRIIELFNNVDACWLITGENSSIEENKNKEVIEQLKSQIVELKKDKLFLQQLIEKMK